MIDPNEVIRNFEENFKKMSYAERETFLKDMGFSFGKPERSRNPKSVRPAVRSNAQASHATVVQYVPKRKKGRTGTIRLGVRVAKNKA